MNSVGEFKIFGKPFKNTVSFDVLTNHTRKLAVVGFLPDTYMPSDLRDTLLEIEPEDLLDELVIDDLLHRINENKRFVGKYTTKSVKEGEVKDLLDSITEPFSVKPVVMKFLKRRDNALFALMQSAIGGNI